MTTKERGDTVAIGTPTSSASCFEGVLEAVVPLLPLVLDTAPSIAEEASRVYSTYPSPSTMHKSPNSKLNASTSSISLRSKSSHCTKNNLELQSRRKWKDRYGLNAIAGRIVMDHRLDAALCKLPCAFCALDRVLSSVGAWSLRIQARNLLNRKWTTVMTRVATIAAASREVIQRARLQSISYVSNVVKVL